MPDHPIAPPGHHDWFTCVARNGDVGFQCQRCRLTAIKLPVPKACEPCPPPPPISTLAELLADA